MITKSSLLVVAMLLATLATPRSAADTISDECGLASVYSTVSEETASGEDTLPADFTAAHSVTAIRDAGHRQKSRKRALGDGAHHRSWPFHWRTNN
ncbi:MAG: hypothetical protein ACXW3G_09805 [Rhodoplanes sp.]